MRQHRAPAFTDLLISSGKVPQKNMRSRITFVVASNFEKQVVRGGISQLRSASARASVLIANCKVGFTDPAALENPLRREYIISTGFAAGLRPSVTSGTILLPRKIIDRNRSALPVDQKYHDRILSVLNHHIALDTAPVVEASEILVTPSDKAAAQIDCDAAGADMESAKIAAFCARHGFPFIALRAVLDPAHASMPRCIATATTNGNVPGALQVIAGLAREPADWPHMTALLRYVYLARQSLRRAIFLAMPGLLQAAADA